MTIPAITPDATDPLFPPIAPYRSGRLPVGSLHTLYWEECGNPQGVPVLFLHGGPGAGLSPKHRQFFDPDHYRIVLFDQRGAGQSTPLGEVRDNTTPLLVQDIEQLRQMLGIDAWLVFGGSWGSTLALAYGQTHPERCTWSRYEGSCLHLLPHPEVAEAFGSDAVALGVGRLEAHYFLHQAWPQASLQIVEDTGHSAQEPGIARALVAATERFKSTGTL